MMVIDISCHAWLVLKASEVDNPYEHDALPKQKTKTDPHEQQKILKESYSVYMILWKYVNFLPEDIAEK